jgi:hypothetical protein
VQLVERNARVPPERRVAQSIERDGRRCDARLKQDRDALAALLRAPACGRDQRCHTAADVTTRR